MSTVWQEFCGQEFRLELRLLKFTRPIFFVQFHFPLTQRGEEHHSFFVLFQTAWERFTAFKRVVFLSPFQDLVCLECHVIFPGEIMSWFSGTSNCGYTMLCCFAGRAFS